MKITLVVGNPKPQSRTARLARMLIDRIFGPDRAEVEVVELADHAAALFTWPSEEMAALNARVAASDLVVFASPTYKATYTGLLKAFLDRYPQNGLERTTALVLMTGGGMAHSMGPTVTLIPLLHELGAVVPVRGFYFNTEMMDRAGEIIDGFAAETLGAFARMVPLLQAAAPRMQDIHPGKTEKTDTPQ
ncbi:NADPH-dependent FMN reductase [Pseudodonghicola flavimaris]|uniref:NAD(P)H-dependent oxidoreductase n=1 Tax=Pseudodonghicola flavimaris TaxID=3050036 RepID=A0ABT7F2V2_9RHOB|nr:NAD(P)H-dependent oxidoreductase [Pseudodonghicola flavimaris]MDK3018912.1 NAD(P)H-dependent oxidoreductase [Pseudodonghicola flavimaris]